MTTQTLSRFFVFTLAFGIAIAAVQDGLGTLIFTLYAMAVGWALGALTRKGAP